MEPDGLYSRITVRGGAIRWPSVRGYQALGRQVTTVVVRSEADAWRALSALGEPDRNSTTSRLRFEGWPRVVVTVPEGIDVVQSSRAVCALQELVERQYCLLKRGTSDRRRLTNWDKAETKIDVEYQLGGTRLVIDLSTAATAAARAVLARNELKRRSGKFDGTREGRPIAAAHGVQVQEQENWPRTVREVSLEALHALRPSQVASLGLAAIIVAALAWSSATMWKESLSHVLAMKREANEHQLKLTELDRTTIISRSAGAVAPAAQRALERELEADVRPIKMLANLELDGPLFKFVVNEVESARPALLDLAPIIGSIDINGLTLQAETARAAAKATRQASKAAKPVNADGGWTAIVQPEPRTIRS